MVVAAGARDAGLGDHDLGGAHRVQDGAGHHELHAPPADRVIVAADDGDGIRSHDSRVVEAPRPDRADDLARPQHRRQQPFVAEGEGHPVGVPRAIATAPRGGARSEGVTQERAPGPQHGRQVGEGDPRRRAIGTRLRPRPAPPHERADRVGVDVEGLVADEAGAQSTEHLVPPRVEPRQRRTSGVRSASTRTPSSPIPATHSACSSRPPPQTSTTMSSIAATRARASMARSPPARRVGLLARRRRRPLRRSRRPSCSCCRRRCRRPRGCVIERSPSNPPERNADRARVPFRP